MKIIVLNKHIFVPGTVVSALNVLTNFYNNPMK